MFNEPIIEILGSGMAVPPGVISNKMLEVRMDTTEAFILEKTGIVERRYVANRQNNSDLMQDAIKQSLADAAVSIDEIDMLIVSTLSPDHHDPSQACLLHGKLPFRNIPVFDLRAQCSSLLYAMYVAEKVVYATPSSKILIVCGEVLSRRIKGNKADRNIAVLLGDGAGAIIVGKSNTNRGLVDIQIGADGKQYNMLISESPGTAFDSFVSPDDITNCRTLFKMQGKELFDHATSTIVSEIQKKLVKHNLRVGDIARIICHQPNVRMLEHIATALGLSKQQLHLNADYFGNMGSASLAVAWSEYAKLAEPGNVSLIIGYGAGSTWGSALYRH